MVSGQGDGLFSLLARAYVTMRERNTYTKERNEGLATGTIHKKHDPGFWGDRDDRAFASAAKQAQIETKKDILQARQQKCADQSHGLSATIPLKKKTFVIDRSEYGQAQAQINVQKKKLALEQARLELQEKKLTCAQAQSAVIRDERILLKDMATYTVTHAPLIVAMLDIYRAHELQKTYDTYRASEKSQATHIFDGDDYRHFRHIDTALAITSQCMSVVPLLGYVLAGDETVSWKRRLFRSGIYGLAVSQSREVNDSVTTSLRTIGMSAAQARWEWDAIKNNSACVYHAQSIATELLPVVSQMMVRLLSLTVPQEAVHDVCSWLLGSRTSELLYFMYKLSLPIGALWYHTGVHMPDLYWYTVNNLMVFMLGMMMRYGVMQAGGYIGELSPLVGEVFREADVSEQYRWELDRLAVIAGSQHGIYKKYVRCAGLNYEQIAFELLHSMTKSMAAADIVHLPFFAASFYIYTYGKHCIFLPIYTQSMLLEKEALTLDDIKAYIVQVKKQVGQYEDWQQANDMTMRIMLKQAE